MSDLVDRANAWIYDAERECIANGVTHKTQAALFLIQDLRARIEELEGALEEAVRALEPRVYLSEEDMLAVLSAARAALAKGEP